MLGNKTQKDALAIEQARSMAQIMRERIKAAEPIAKMWIGKMKAQQAQTSGTIKAELKFTATPQIFTAVGSMFSNNNSDCAITLNGGSSELKVSGEFSRNQYERFIIPLCAAFNLTNDNRAKISLTQLKK